MDVKPGYKMTEVGVIPEDWDVSVVGNEFYVQLGKMLDEQKNQGVQKPFLGNSAVQWGRIDISDIGQIKMSLSDMNRFRLQHGDLLVCEGGEVGRSAIWYSQLQALHRLKPKRTYSPKLMLFILQYFSESGFLQSYVIQTSIAHLPKDKFLSLPVPLLKNAEQEAIAEALSDADVLVESLEQLIEKKRLIKQGAMHELLTGKRRLPGLMGHGRRKLWGICSISAAATQLHVTSFIGRT